MPSKEEEKKVCRICGVEKGVEEFYLRTPTLRRTECKECLKKKRNKNYQNNKKTILIAGKIYRAENKEKINKEKRARYQKNKEKILAQQAINYQINRTAILAKSKANIEKTRPVKQAWRRKNRKHLREYERQYRLKNKNKLNAHSIVRRQKRLETDPIYKLRLTISGVIRAVLNGAKRGQSILKYLPYTFDQLKAHIENQFEPWMNWKNWGMYNYSSWNDNDQTTWVWNLDHIIPQADLPYTSMEEDNFKKCWGLENLRPYSAKQNILDGDRKKKK